jgi:hypothetical protein
MAKKQATKVTLSSGKIVLLRELKISDTELAAQEVASRANGDQLLMQVFMQKALLKNLLLQVDGKTVDAVEREDLDSLFTAAEYGQLISVMNKLSGGDDAKKEPGLEVVFTGDI